MNKFNHSGECDISGFIITKVLLNGNQLGDESQLLSPQNDTNFRVVAFWNLGRIGAS